MAEIFGLLGILAISSLMAIPPENKEGDSPSFIIIDEDKNGEKIQEKE